MIPQFRLLPGLPPYGPLATGFPPEWGRLAREGIVVEFDTDSGPWVANFQPGFGRLNLIRPHPNNRDVVVVVSGDLWVVAPRSRTANLLLPDIDAAVEVHDPEGWVFNRMGMALARLGPAGLIWHTRRLAVDGLDGLTVVGDELTGMAWSPAPDTWRSFRVDLRTGRSSGGSLTGTDKDKWERLATS